MEEKYKSSQEEVRIAELKSYRILDTSPEPFFADITQLASEICQAPIAFVGFMDRERNWFKAKVGTEHREVPREISFCNEVISSGETLIITDLSADPLYRNHPMVMQQPQLRFYMGVPLFSPNHHVLGTICVLDVRPRQLSTAQMNSMFALQRMVNIFLENYRSRDQRSDAVRDFILRDRRSA